MMAQHWSAHGIIACLAAAVAAYVWVSARTARDRYGLLALATAAAILAFGLTYMGGA